MEARFGKNSLPSSMVGVAGVVAVIELFLVLVLAELVLANLLLWISCGFVPLCSICPSWDQPSAENAPFLISGNVGIFDPTSPVACHMPSGGLLFRKLCLKDPVRVLRPELDDAAVGDRPALLMGWGSALLAAEATGERLGKASVSFEAIASD